MRCRTGPVTVALLVLVGIASPGLASAVETPSARLIDELLAATGSKVVDCPAEVDAYGTVRDAVCAVSGVPGKALKRTLKSMLKEDDGAVRLPGALWEARHEYDVARFFVDRELFVLRYDPRDGGLALLPHQSCFSPASLTAAGVLTAREAGVVPPKLLELPRPAYPEAARVERRNGFVMVQAAVNGDGTVARSCVLYAVPEGLGFREAALEAVNAARYEPGTRDGRPVGVLVNESVTWEIR